MKTVIPAPIKPPPPVNPETLRHNLATEAQATATEKATAAYRNAELALRRTEAEKKADPLVKVEHKDDATGRTIIEWLPKSTLSGKTFQKGEGATVENRLASATAVTQTGNDLIAKLSDPAFAAKVGPAMGRFNSLRDFIGNPPPEYADLAGQIESYALANMGVHGMRSTQGADEIKKLLDKKHTPESMIATLKGLNSFATHLLQNEGRPPVGTPTGTPAPNDPLGIR